MGGIAYFEIQAYDPESAVRFYREIFGWNFIEQDGLPIPYWRIETDGVRGGLLKRPAATPPPQAMAQMPMSVLWRSIVLML